MARPAPHGLRRLLAGWHRAECALAVAAFAAVALLLVGDVLGRELLGPLLRALGLPAVGAGIYGAPRLAVYALAVGIWAGVGVAAATGTHFVPRVTFRAVPQRWQPAIERLGDAVSAALLLAAAWYAARMVAGSADTGLLAPMMQWPVWPVQLAMPLGLASAALRYACFSRWPDLRPQRVEAAP